MKIGALPEFRTRYEGLDGLREVYGLRNLRVTAVESDGRYPALDSGEVDVASVFTTEGQLAGEPLRRARGPARPLRLRHVAPIISDKVLEAHGPGLRRRSTPSRAKLTTAAMRG